MYVLLRNQVYNLDTSSTMFGPICTPLPKTERQRIWMIVKLYCTDSHNRSERLVCHGRLFHHSNTRDARLRL